MLVAFFIINPWEQEVQLQILLTTHAPICMPNKNWFWRSPTLAQFEIVDTQNFWRNQASCAGAGPDCISKKLVLEFPINRLKPNFPSLYFFVETKRAVQVLDLILKAETGFRVPYQSGSNPIFCHLQLLETSSGLCRCWTWFQKQMPWPSWRLDVYIAQQNTGKPPPLFRFA